MKAGLILPQSDRIPQLYFQFFNGLTMSAPDSIEWVIETVSGDAKSSDIQNLCNKFLLQHQVGLSVVMISEKNSQSLRKIFHAAKKALVIANTGANFPIAFEASPYIWTHSLMHWKSMYTLGYSIAQSDTNNVLLVSSFYDGGFDANDAFCQGLEANGGQIAGWLMSPPNVYSFNREQFLEQLEASQANQLVVLLSGEEANGFLEMLAGIEEVSLPPIAISPFVTGTQENPHYFDLLPEMKSMMAWTPEINSAINQEFTQEYEVTYDMIPDAFAVLGYEIGQSLALFMEKYDRFNKNNLAEFRQGLSWESPRGKVCWEPETQQILGSEYSVVTFPKDGKYKKRVLQSADIPDFDIASFISPVENTEKGWTNVYLC